MGARRDIDSPGLWHHVSTRALARRPYFEVELDYQRFFDLLAEVVVDQRIEIHAFCLMTNHVHLLVRSLDGRLSDTFRDVFSRFSRGFNRLRDRDGPLVRGRFFSRIVHDATDRFVVTRYIDHNPVRARLVTRVTDYEFGSAWHFARGTAPGWLSTADVRETVEALAGSPLNFGTYSEVFDPRPPAALDWVVEQKLRAAPGSGTDAFARLVTSSKTEIEEWLADAALLADGMRIGCSIIPPENVQAAVDRMRQIDPDWRCKPGHKRRSGWPILAAALLVLASRETYQATSIRLQLSRNTVDRCLRDHWILMQTDAEYARRAADITHAELRAMLPTKYLRKSAWQR